MKRLAFVAVLALGLGLVSCTDGKGGQTGETTRNVSKDYKNYEVVTNDGKLVYVKFRVSLTTLGDYVNSKVTDLEGKVKAATNDDQKKGLQGGLDYWKTMSSNVKAGKPEAICVFGDFNAWKTFVSDVPNLFEASKDADVWYTPKLIPFDVAKLTNKYKFVISFGKKADGSDNWLYIEDPKNANKIDDGFGGFNSIFIITK